MNQSSIGRPVPSLGRTFGGVWWLTFNSCFTIKAWLTIVLGTSVLVLIGLTSTAAGDGPQFYGWVRDFYFLFVAPLLIFATAGRAMRDQMKSPSVDYIFTRPVHRSMYVVFKYVAHVAATALIYLPPLAAVLVLGWYRQAPDLWLVAPRLLLTQLLLVAATCGFGFFFGALTSRYIVLGLVYGFLVEKGLGAIPTRVASLSVSRHLTTLLQFDRANPSWAASGVAIVMLILFAVLTVVASALVIQRREFLGDGSKGV